MSDIPYWTDNWFATHEIKKNFSRLKQQVRDARQDSASDLRTVLAGIDQLEVDVGRTLLKLHAIVDVLNEKGIVTTEELASRARDLDAMDGAPDGILHPSLFRTAEERNRTPSPRAFLIELEKQTTSPKEFLAQLEKKDEKQDDDAKD